MDDESTRRLRASSFALSLSSQQSCGSELADAEPREAPSVPNLTDLPARLAKEAKKAKELPRVAVVPVPGGVFLRFFRGQPIAGEQDRSRPSAPGRRAILSVWRRA